MLMNVNLLETKFDQFSINVSTPLPKWMRETQSTISSPCFHTIGDLFTQFSEHEHDHVEFML